MHGTLEVEDINLAAIAIRTAAAAAAARQPSRNACTCLLAGQARL